MNVTHKAGGVRGQGVDVDFCGLAGELNKLGAGCVELRSAAFVPVDVGISVRKDAAPGRGDCRQRKGIRCRSGRDEKNVHLVLEHFREPALDRGRQIVVAIGTSLARIASCHGSDDLRGCSGNVVAPEATGTTGFACKIAVRVHFFDAFAVVIFGVRITARTPGLLNDIQAFR